MNPPRFVVTAMTRWAFLVAGVAAFSPVHASARLDQSDIRWLQRATFGVDSSAASRYAQLGHARYLADELAGGHDTLPTSITALMRSYEVVNTPPRQLWRTYREQQKQVKALPAGPAQLAAKKSLQAWRRGIRAQNAEVAALHMIYGGNQIKEQMVWFWLNHFSVYAAKGRVSLLVNDYAENTIRPHALGRFSDLVMATLKSPAMLEYLDNAKNIKGKTNENYARELMELHTLGAGAGYTQQDVQQLALILTGAGVKLREGRRARARHDSGEVAQGLFAFVPARHDFTDKTLLGQPIRGDGLAEIERAVKLITRQPACASFIARQLAVYFIDDDPPPTIVKAMASTFQRTDGDIAAVLRTMFESPSFTTSGRKFKDPTRFVVSAIRLAYDGQPVGNALPVVRWLDVMGEPLFGRITPDGWPLAGTSWDSSGQMATRFDVARAIGGGRNRLFAPGDAKSAPKPRADPPMLDTPLYRMAYAPWLSAATRDALAKARNATEWNTYLLSSPDFNYR